jgi:hypothetical protein
MLWATTPLRIVIRRRHFEPSIKDNARDMPNQPQ